MLLFSSFYFDKIYFLNYFSVSFSVIRQMHSLYFILLNFSCLIMLYVKINFDQLILICIYYLNITFYMGCYN